MKEDEILSKLEKLETLISQQALLQKDMLNLEEACQYLELSKSHLYKLTSTHQIPHYCPNGKKLYFRREELDNWLKRNPQSTIEDTEKAASNYLLNNRKKIS